jgi:hypothetical protein
MPENPYQPPKERGPMFGRDAWLGLLFILVGSFAVLQYIGGDFVTAGIGLAASVVIAVLFVRAVVRNPGTN